MPESAKEKWSGYREGQEIGRINSRKARSPESPWIEIVRGIGVNRIKPERTKKKFTPI
jgi:hypothetical protein